MSAAIYTITTMKILVRYLFLPYVLYVRYGKRDMVHIPCGRAKSSGFKKFNNCEKSVSPIIMGSMPFKSSIQEDSIEYLLIIVPQKLTHLQLINIVLN